MNANLLEITLLEQLDAGVWPTTTTVLEAPPEQIDELRRFAIDLEIWANLPSSPIEARHFCCALKARLAGR